MDELLKTLLNAQPIDDRVMGGHSESRVTALPAGGIAFTGCVRLESGGGFASVRALLPQAGRRTGQTNGTETRQPSGLTDSNGATATGLMLNISGDNKIYQLRIGTSKIAADVSYCFSFVAGAMGIVVAPFAVFYGSRRGREVSLPPLKGVDITSIGLLIGGRQAGPFRLEVLSIQILV